jgi:hypothetical protein
MRKLTIATLALLLSAPTGFSQKLEHFDVLLFALNRKPDSVWYPFAPRFLTTYNSGGYNNQPQFVSPHELYLTVQMPADTTQTDIYALNLLLNTTTRVTATTTPEYSPTPMPGGKRFSAVRRPTALVLSAGSLRQRPAHPARHHQRRLPLLAARHPARAFSGGRK